MLYACLCTICFVFCYTSWRFYIFSGTNVLTRCHSASFLFSDVLCFRKATQEIFSEVDETKAEVPIFPDTRRRGPEGSRTMGRRSLPLARANRWWGHLAHLLTSPFCLYIILDEKTLRARSIFQKTYCKPPSLSTRDQEGPEALPGNLRRGESSPEAFFITMPASGVMCE
jgi:hypothetical protein